MSRAVSREPGGERADRIQELFVAVAELDASARVALLDERRTDDEELRSEVIELLEADERILQDSGS